MKSEKQNLNSEKYMLPSPIGLDGLPFFWPTNAWFMLITEQLLKMECSKDTASVPTC